MLLQWMKKVEVKDCARLAVIATIFTCWGSYIRSVCLKIKLRYIEKAGKAGVASCQLSIYI